MIYQDRKLELDNQLAITEYLASFWNPEAVKKIQETRSNSAKHKFKEDQEFEEYVLSGNYKHNPLLDAVQKIKQLEMDKNIKVPQSNNRGSSKSKLPTNLSSIRSTMEKFK